jgi:hypothetical protein
MEEAAFARRMESNVLLCAVAAWPVAVIEYVDYLVPITDGMIPVL